MSTRPDASMSLLRDLFDNPLDAGYRARAERRSAAPSGPVPAWQRLLLVLLCAVLAAAAVWSAKELRRPAGDGGNPARALLTDQITQRSAAVDELSAANAETAAEIAALREAALAGGDQELRTRLATLSSSVGTTAVTGPGLTITLEDSRAAREGQPGAEGGRVQDRDLQVIVNGLWAAGAEAVAINDRRLTATSAIRSAGPVVLVDLAAVVPPYTVKAIGDAPELQVGLARTNAGQHMQALRETYDIRVDIAAVDRLVLPRTTTSALRFAEPVCREGAACS